MNVKSLACTLLIASLSYACGDGGSSSPQGKPSDEELHDKIEPFVSSEQARGSYLLVVSTVVAPRIPVVVLTEIDADENGDELELKLRVRTLSKLDRKTPVGPWSDWMPATLAADGTLHSEPLAITIPADANAITGFDTDAEITLNGAINVGGDESSDAAVRFICGDLTGRILRPIPIDDLSGSTFTATRIDDVDDVDSYPEAVINCAGAPARPL